MFIYVYIHVYICIYIYIHIYTYIAYIPICIHNPTKPTNFYAQNHKLLPIRPQLQPYSTTKLEHCNNTTLQTCNPTLQH